MSNIGGPSSKKRKVLANVVSSIILYGAPIWIPGMEIKRHRNRVKSVQRKVALKITMGYRTVSMDEVMVITRRIPIHLLAEDRKNIF